MQKKWVIVGGVVLVLIALTIGGIFIFRNKSIEKEIPPAQIVEETSGPKQEIIGYSVEGRAIESYIFGKGKNLLAFVGGIHGGYEWNSVVLAYQFIDYFTKYPETIPENLSIAIIPSANPDGVFKVVGKEGRFSEAEVLIKNDTTGIGRFNANNVDLNRNFDCKWKSESSWRSKKVSAGTQAFSEPEAKAIQGFVKAHSPKSVVFWHSQANAVYASECEKGILPETLEIMNSYSKASGYKAVQTFDSYEITGDAEGWLASIGIPAITVELETHATVEWERNLAGVKALMGYYSESIWYN